ncbi:MAG: septum formation initiator family protein [Actinobacteria bacterium]|nr:MAG: septum formation initiator family protein [Actinomycetota bacterium]
MSIAFEPASDSDIEIVRKQLDRIPRGVVGIGDRCVCGRPTVVVTAPRLEDGTPFPTTFYLTSPPIVRACSVLEAEKVMEEMNAWLDEDETAQTDYRHAHEHYIMLREQLGKVPEIAGISAGGMPTRVKCLHALVGHALVAGRGVNNVGDRALDIMAERGLWTEGHCSC